MEESKHKYTCDCTHHHTVPLIVILIAILFLLNALSVINNFSVAVLWPILAIIGATSKMCENNCKCC